MVDLHLRCKMWMERRKRKKEVPLNLNWKLRARNYHLGTRRMVVMMRRFFFFYLAHKGGWMIIEENMFLVIDSKYQYMNVIEGSRCDFDESETQAQN